MEKHTIHANVTFGWKVQVSTKTNFAERSRKLVVIHVREVITDALDKENVYEENYFFNLQKGTIHFCQRIGSKVKWRLYIN